MPTAAVHCSLNVSSLDASVAFYRALTGLDPVKRQPDYAKFELVDPPVVLSLIAAQSSGQNPINHLGLRVASLDELETVRARLRQFGLDCPLEEEVECCYSTQTKFWAADPDGTHWEIYVFHEDAPGLGVTAPPPVPALASNRAAIWTHRLGDGWVARIPHADGALDEVLLEGSINLSSGSGSLAALLAEARRALAPAGRISLHGLVASQPVAAGALSLPGPAAAVQRVPTEAEPLAEVARAGFVNVRLVHLAEKPHFTVGGAELREILVSAMQPPTGDAEVHRMIYRGPFASVIDDAGVTHVRGERSYVRGPRHAALMGGPAAGDFAQPSPQAGPTPAPASTHPDAAAAGTCCPDG